MKGRVDLSISYIHTNWLVAKKLRLARLSQNNLRLARLSQNNLRLARLSQNNLRLAKLSQNNSNIHHKLPIINKRQGQEGKRQAEEGCFHVFVRGYNSYTLFYDNEDRVHFLLILDEEAKKYKAKVSAFILMDNHFHLQIVTSHLSLVMKAVLGRYSLRFRRKYNVIDEVFKRPFGRSQFFSYLLAKENLLYIFSNASREQMCATHRDYIWSSYNSHPEVIQLRENGMLPLFGDSKVSAKFKDKEEFDSKSSCLNSKAPLPIPKRGRGSLPSAKMILQNDINQVITVDNSFIIKSFKDLEDLDYAIHSYEPLKTQLITKQQLNWSQDSYHNSYQDSHHDSKQDSPHNSNFYRSQKNNNYFKITPDSEVIALLIDLLDGRKLTSLSSNEQAHIINKLKIEKKATHRQISSIMRI